MDPKPEKQAAALWSLLEQEFEEVDYPRALKTINELRGLATVKNSTTDIQVLLASRFLTLLSLGEYEQALTQYAALVQFSSAHGSDGTCAPKGTVESIFSFEKIYCLYKANKCGVGLHELERWFPAEQFDSSDMSPASNCHPKFVPPRLSSEPTRTESSVPPEAIALLRGLLLYRVGLCDLAKKYFSDILARNEVSDETASFLAVNIAACDACISRKPQGFRNSHPPETEELRNVQARNCYPFTFNLATARIQQGLPHAALQLLELARDQWTTLGEKLRSNDANDNTFDESDLNLINLQAAVAKQQTRSGRSEAESEYKGYVELLGNPPRPTCTKFAARDLSVSTVVLNNLAIISNQPMAIPPLLGAPTWFKFNCLGGFQCDRKWDCPSLRKGYWQRMKSPQLIMKHFATGYSQSPSLRLSRPQVEAVVRNRAIALLRTKKFDDCRAYLKDIGFPACRVCAATAELEASALLGAKQYKTAAEQLFFSGMRLLDQGNAEGLRHLLLATTAALFGKHFELSKAILEQVPSSVVIQLGNNGLIRAYYRALFALAPAVACKDVSHNAKTLTDFYHFPTKQIPEENPKIHPWSFIDSCTIDGQSVLAVLGDVFLRYNRFEAAKRCFELSPSKTSFGPAVQFYAETCAAASHPVAEERDRFCGQFAQLSKAAISEQLKSPTMNHIDPDDVESMVIRVTRADTKRINKLCEVVKSTQCLSTVALQLQDEIAARIVFPTEEAVTSRASARKPGRRRHKIRYPKGFDPNNPTATPLPDPDRWLSKKLRLAKMKGSTTTKKAVAKAMRAAQGAVSAPGTNVGRKRVAKRQGKP